MLSKTITKHTSQSLIRLFFSHQNFFSNSSKTDNGTHNTSLLEKSQHSSLGSKVPSTYGNLKESSAPSSLIEPEEDQFLYHSIILGKSDAKDDASEDFQRFKYCMLPVFFLIYNSLNKDSSYAISSEPDISHIYTFVSDCLIEY